MGDGWGERVRILSVGNLNRMGEIFVKIFRELGHDADLLVWHPTCKPTVEIEPIDVRGSPKAKELNLFRALLRLRNQYDLFICHFAFQSAIIADVLGLRYVAHVRGYDATHNPTHPFYGVFVRSAFRNAKAIWCSTPVLMKYVRHLNANTHFLPNIIKTDVYKPMKVKRRKEDRDRLTVFMPSRHTWVNKRNDLALLMFKEISERRDAKLMMIGWGEDVERTKRLIGKLGLSNVEWRKHTFDEEALARMYSEADVVWDSFGITKDRLNLVGLEAMACNANFLSTELEADAYPDPPIVQAKSVEDIIEKTIDFKNPKKNRQRDWVKRHFSHESVKEQLWALLEEVLPFEEWEWREVSRMQWKYRPKGSFI